MDKADKIFELYQTYKCQRCDRSKAPLLQEVHCWKENNESPTKDGETLLTRVILDAENELAKELIEALHFGINDPSDTGMYPLHHAVYMDNLAICDMLLNHGADVNSVEKQQCNTPLHVALKRQVVSTHMVTLLVEGGANPELKNLYKECPSELAKRYDEQNLGYRIADILQMAKNVDRQPGLRTLTKRVANLQKQTSSHAERLDELGQQVAETRMELQEFKSETDKHLAKSAHQISQHTESTSRDLENLKVISENFLKSLQTQQSNDISSPVASYDSEDGYADLSTLIVAPSDTKTLGSVPSVGSHTVSTSVERNASTRVDTNNSETEYVECRTSESPPDGAYSNPLDSTSNIKPKVKANWSSGYEIPDVRQVPIEYHNIGTEPDSTQPDLLEKKDRDAMRKGIHTFAQNAKLEHLLTKFFSEEVLTHLEFEALLQKTGNHHDLAVGFYMTMMKGKKSTLKIVREIFTEDNQHDIASLFPVGERQSDATLVFRL